MTVNPQMLSPAFQQTRHARRIYVGGIPPNYADEEALKYFLNSVIAKGIGEENDNGYVLSMYINQKKCFAFVELRSIELATACLALDSIVYKKVVLKVLRANEYKPELVPPSMLGKPIVLDLSSFAFGTPAAPVTNTQAVPLQSITNIIKEQQESDLRLDSIIQFNAPVPSIEKKSIVMVGFPYDENLIRRALSASINSSNSNSNHSILGREGRSMLGGGLGCAAAPKVIRQTIRKMKFGAVENPEFDINLSSTKIADIGDIPSGATPEDTKHNLSRIVAEAICRGGVPFIVGGSAECSYYSALGLMDIVPNGSIGVVSVSAQLGDNRLLEDSRFCGPISSSMYDLTSATGFASVQAMQGTTGSGKLTAVTVTAATSPAAETSGSISSAASAASPVAPIVAAPGLSKKLDNSCDGKYVRFGAQGSQCSTEAARYIVDRGGQIMWLTRDIRNKRLASSPTSTVVTSQAGAWFERALKNAAYGSKGDKPPCNGSGESGGQLPQVQPVIVSLDMGVLQYWNTTVNSTNVISNLNNNSHVNTNNSAIGLTIDEVLEIAMIAGSDPNVVVFDLTEFNPEAEDSSRGNLLPAELFYRFALGVAGRPSTLPVVDCDSESCLKYLKAPSTDGISSGGGGGGSGGHTPIVMIHQSNLNNNSLDNMLVSSQKAAAQAVALKEKQLRDTAVVAGGGAAVPAASAVGGGVGISDAASLSSTSFDSYCRLNSISMDDQSLPGVGGVSLGGSGNIMHLSAEQGQYADLHYGHNKGRGLAAPLVQAPHQMLSRQLSMGPPSLQQQQQMQQQQHQHPPQQYFGSAVPLSSQQQQAPLHQQLSQYELHEPSLSDGRGAFTESSFAALEFARDGYHPSMGHNLGGGGGQLSARAMSDNAMPLSHQNSYMSVGGGGINGNLSGRSMSDNAITGPMRGGGGGFPGTYNNSSSNSLVNGQYGGPPQTYRGESVGGGVAGGLYDSLKSPISPVRPGGVPPHLLPPSLASPPHPSQGGGGGGPPGTPQQHPVGGGSLSAPPSANRGLPIGSSTPDQRYAQQQYQQQQQQQPFNNQRSVQQQQQQQYPHMEKGPQSNHQMFGYDELARQQQQQQQQFGGHMNNSRPGQQPTHLGYPNNAQQQQQQTYQQYSRQQQQQQAAANADLAGLGPPLNREVLNAAANHPRGGNLFRAASNMSMISTSDIHEFDEAVDLFDHNSGASRARTSHAAQHHINNASASFLLNQGNQVAQQQQQQQSSNSMYLGSSASTAGNTNTDIWNLK